MESTHVHNAQAALLSLEAAAITTRGGFGCLFSSSDEYETALIAERRAQGRYGRPNSPWAALMFVGLTLMVIGTVLLFS
jgi:hypothetical protein